MKINIKIASIAAFAAMALSANAQGLDLATLSQIAGSYTNSPADKALRNAINSNAIDKLAKNSGNANAVNQRFSNKVNSKGITNQKRSGRCWLFTGQNVLRAQMMAKHNLPELKLSQNYNFFYDQLEKANLFLQGIIDTAKRPADDKTVDWLFSNPMSDGGQYTGISDNFMKYGVVPAEVMHETESSEGTDKLRQILSLRLREDGLRLREKAASGVSANALQQEKIKMLSAVYRILVLTLGEPVKEFTWTRCDKDGNPVETKTYTPQSFYKEYAGNDLKNDYIMLMNDPSREYYKLYEIDFDRHVYDGKNWTYVNLPIEDIKEMAIKSIQDSTMMYFSCDVNKFLDRDRGYLDINNYDYDSLFGTKFGMNKKERILTHASGSSHAMTLMAVDLDKDGKPTRWMVENSWGDGANEGHLIMTDEWFNEYMFRLVVNKKYATAKTLEILKQKPTLLPAWDPMFAEEN
ncbi:MAG: C1 family peptidase [Bacteroidaceae bacterium]|nr:C1 family peptidase [Bacteroidaceae bacterium]